MPGDCCHPNFPVYKSVVSCSAQGDTLYTCFGTLGHHHAVVHLRQHQKAWLHGVLGSWGLLCLAAHVWGPLPSQPPWLQLPCQLLSPRPQPAHVFCNVITPFCSCRVASKPERTRLSRLVLRSGLGLWLGLILCSSVAALTCSTA